MNRELRRTVWRSEGVRARLAEGVELIARGGGTVINISSLAAIRAIPKMGAYAMAKAAMEALTRQIASDYAADNIRCN